jgi:hypothetical protein
MGCGTSVPKEIIPDPTPSQECKVLFKKTGMMSRDQYVYQDLNKEKKWLLMDKEGSLFSNPTYVLENFVRGKNPNKKNEGECLCAAKLEVTEAKTYGFETHEDSDSSEAESGEWGEESDVVVVKMKWRQGIKVKFYRDRERTDMIAEVKVKAKGKAKKTTKTTMETVTTTDSDGNSSSEEVERVAVTIEKKVTKVKYTITELKDEGKELPPIKMEGKPNGKAGKLRWESPVFNAEIDPKGGFSSDQIEVHTNWKNPALGMLMGYIIAKDISPDDIKDKVVVW